MGHSVCHLPHGPLPFDLLNGGQVTTEVIVKSTTLKEKAAFIRRLARNSGNDLAMELLLALATETEAKAAKAEQQRKALIHAPGDHSDGDA
jgi:hypothetical protein